MPRYYLWSLLLVNACEATNQGGDADAETQDAAPTPCTPATFGTSGTGCQDDEVCLDGYGCYPLAGLAGSTCSDLPSITVSLQINVDGPQDQMEYEGEVLQVTNTSLSIETEAGPVSVMYDIGNYALPLVEGERVRLMWRRVRTFGEANGVALWNSSDELLFVADDGAFGSSWSGPTPEPIPSGFSVHPEMAGCAATREHCYTRLRMALRFKHASGTEVLVMPGGSALLELASGQSFRVVNAHTEALLEVVCTDQVTRIAWLIIAN